MMMCGVGLLRVRARIRVRVPACACALAIDTSISIDNGIRDGMPRAATCSWSLRLPNYMVSDVFVTLRLIVIVAKGAGRSCPRLSSGSRSHDRGSVGSR